MGVFYWGFSFFLFAIYRYLLGPWIPFFMEKVVKPFLKEGKVKQSLELRREALIQIRAFQEQGLFPSDSCSSRLPWVWFHCASGEVEYAKPLLRSLQKEGKVRVLLTYFSPSLLPLLEREETKWADVLLPLPWDRPHAMASLLKVFSPKALLLAHTDLWPEMLYQAKKAGVPVLYFSVQCLSPSSKGPSFLKRIFWHFSSRLLTEVYCIEEEDRQWLKKSFPCLKVEKGGNTRIDEMLYKQKEGGNESHKTKVRGLFPLFSSCKEEGDLVFVAGSTWPEDEKFFLFLARHYFQNHKGGREQDLKDGKKRDEVYGGRARQSLRWVLVPHDPTPERLKAIFYECQKFHLKVCLYSQVQTHTKKNPMEKQSRDAEPWTNTRTNTRTNAWTNALAKSWEKDTILLVDQVGLLARIYQFGHLALVGGGFERGAHSLLEPFAWGLPLLVGPRCENQPEFRYLQKISVPPLSPSPSLSSSPSSSLSSLSSLKALNIFSSFQEGRDVFMEILSILEAGKGAHIRQFLQERCKTQAGASRKALDWLEQQLIT